MEHEEFTSDNLDHSPCVNQGFQADKFTKVNNYLNIPDTIPEHSSPESRRNSMKMEANKSDGRESFIDENKENIYCNSIKSDESSSSGTIIAVDNSFIINCERKLLENSSSDEEKSIDSNNSVESGFFREIPRKLGFKNETISTPPSTLRKQLGILRSEMAEAHEFHDLELKVLKEEEFLNGRDPENIAKWVEKYAFLMELYTSLKNEYDAYRREQEKLQYKTADCLDSLCSQIEASDNSLNYSNASFLSFGPEIKSSTIMEEISEVEATVVHDGTLWVHDPLSITNDGKPSKGVNNEMALAEDDALKLKSQFLSLEAEKIEIEKRCMELEEANSNLQTIINTKETILKDMECFKSLYEKVQRECENVKQQNQEIQLINSSLKTQLEEGNSKLEAEIKCKEEALKNLEELTVSYDKLQITNEALKERIAEMEKIIVDLENLNKETENKNSDLNQEITQLGEIIENLKTDLGLAQGEKTSNDSKLKDLLDEISSLKTEKENMLGHSERVQLLEEEKKNLADVLLDIQSSLDLPTDTMSEVLTGNFGNKKSVSEKINNFIKAQKEEFNSSCEKLQNENSSLKERVAEMEKIIADLESFKGETENKQRELDQEITNLGEVVSGLKTDLNLALEEKNLKDSQLKDLLEEIRTLKTEKENLMGHSEKVQSLEEEKKNLADVLFDIQSCLDMPVEAIDELLAGNFESKKTFSDRINTLIKTQEEHSLSYEKLQNEKETLQHQITELEQVIMSLKTDSKETDRESEKLELENQCHELKERNSQLEAEFKLKEEEMLKNLGEYKSSKEKIQHENEALNLRIAELEQMITALKNDLEVAEERNSSKVNEMMEEIEKLQHVNEGLINNLKESRKSLGDVLFNVQTEREALQSECENLKQQNEEIQSLNSDLKTQLDEAREKLTLNDSEEAKMVELKELNLKLEADLKSKEEELNKKLEKFNSTNEELRRENEALKLRIIELEQMIAELKTNSELAREENNSKVNEMIQEIEQLQKENQDVLTTLKESRKSLEDALLNDLSTDNIPVDRVTQKMAGFQKEESILSVVSEIITESCKGVQEKMIKKLESKKTEWESQRNSDLTLIDNLETQLKSLTERNADHECKISEINTEKDDLRKLYDELIGKMSEKENLIVSYKEEILGLQSQEATLKQTKETAEEMVAKLQVQVSTVQGEVSESESKYRELEKATSNLRLEIETKDTRIKDLEALNREAEDKNFDLSQEITNLREIIENLKTGLSLAQEETNTKLKDLLEEISSLKTEKENLVGTSEKLQCLEEEKNSWRDVLTDIQSCLDMSTDAASELLSGNFEKGKIFSEKINILIKTQKEEFDATNEKLQAANESLKEEIASLEKKIETLNRETENKNKDLNEEIERLGEDVANLKADLELAQKEKNSMESRLKDLVNEIETLKTEKEDLVGRLEKMRSLEEENKNLTDVLLDMQSYLDMPIEIMSEVLSGDFENKKIFTERIHSLMTLQKEEFSSVTEKLESENETLKQRIAELEDLITELKSNSELAREEKNSKLNEMVQEMEKLQKENEDVVNTLKERRKSLEDVLLNVGTDDGLPGDRVSKYVAKTSQLYKKESTVSVVLEIITESCKGVQEEMVRKYESKKIEWESQRNADLTVIDNLEKQIKSLVEKNIDHESKLLENDNLKKLYDELMEKVSEKENLISSCREEIENLLSEGTALKRTKEAAEEMMTELENQLSAAQRELSEMESQTRKLEKTTSNLRLEIETKETRIKDLEMANRQTENRNTDLNREIAELKTGLEEKKSMESDLLNEIETLKKEKEDLVGRSKVVECLEEEKKKLADVLIDIQSCLDMPTDTTSKLLSGNVENRKIFTERIKTVMKTQTEELKLENQNLKLGNENLKSRVKELSQMYELESNQLKEEAGSLNASLPHVMSLRNKGGKNVDLRTRRLDKLEEINHNLVELLMRILTMTEFPDLDKLKLTSVRDFPNAMKKVVAHIKNIETRMNDLKAENAKLDEECDSYAKTIKDLKKEAVGVWKTNKQKTDAMAEEIAQLKEKQNVLENEKRELLAKISKLEKEIEKVQSGSKSEGSLHACTCGNELKKINDLKRTILMKEQKILELQDLENQNVSYRKQIEYLENALEREKKKITEEKQKNKKLQNDLNEVAKNQKTQEKKSDENQMLDELRMRGSISGGIVQEFVDKEKMRKLAKDIGILKELCRARYAEIKRLEAENAALKNGTPKNSNQMDSPLRTRGYNTRSKNPVRDLWKTEISGKENSAL